MNTLPSYTPVVQVSSESLLNSKKDEKFRDVIWTTDIKKELPIFLTQTGIGNLPPLTVMDFFEQTVRDAEHEEALLAQRNGKWVSWTWHQFKKDAVHFAKALISVGVQPFECVNILAFNSPEWFETFIGSIYACAPCVGIYLTNNSQTCMYIANHSECGCLVIDSLEQFKKYDLSVLKHLKAVVFTCDITPEELKALNNPYATCYTWNDFLEMGKSGKVDLEFKRRREMQKPGNCCDIVYTSGTTGIPKAVMLSHDNLTWTVRALRIMNEEYIEDRQKCVSYLPLSHIAGQIVDIMLPIISKSKVYFAKPDALAGSLVETLKDVRPTAFFGVPRVYEKMEEKIKATASESSSFKQKILSWAMDIGNRAIDNGFRGESMPWFFSLADFLVFRKLKDAMGLDQVKFFTFGAAPMKKSTLKFFKSLTIPLYNTYGMSESTGPQFLNIGLRDIDLKSAGSHLSGTNCKIANQDKDGVGEICFRGRNRFMGYYKNEEATLESIDEEGFIHSGDQGYIDKKGNLFITGRFKEILKTAGGEMVAPLPIEESIIASSPIFNNVVVIGDDRKYLSVLLTLKGDPNGNLSPEVMAAFKGVNPGIKTILEAMNDSAVTNYIQSVIDKVNKTAVSRAQLIRKWVIIPHEFSVDGGEITPTLKLKRKAIAQKYAKEIELMYVEGKM